MGCEEAAFTTGDVVSLLVALAALVVAAASLYYAALRRASLDPLDVIFKTLSPGRFEAPGMTSNDVIRMQIYLANSGAAGTFLEDFDVTDFRYHGDGPPLWSGFDQTRKLDVSRVRRGTVLERGTPTAVLSVRTWLARPT
jgi:hypothetical protein